ncbi:MAG: PhzF family phenazine biosynthesis protein [Pseudomonadota bacterium]
MALTFTTYDVFTDVPFGGNPLAVVEGAEGLSTRAMQAIAREFNLSETVFVLPPGAGGHARLRIFTPLIEIPFAGHPTVGAAVHLLAGGAPDRFTLEVGAGPMAVVRDGPNGARFTAPGTFREGAALPMELVCACLDVPEAAIETDIHPPMIADHGIAFGLVALRDLATLSGLRHNAAAFAAYEPAWQKIAPGTVALYAYAPEGEGFRARMFEPTGGIPEDPATGSAAAALAGLLQKRGKFLATRQILVQQGVEMGRPSRIRLGATSPGSAGAQIVVAGDAVRIMRGEIDAVYPH